MVKRIIFSGILLCMFIAIPLALMGIERVELGTPFLSFMNNVNRELNEFKIAIPEIPEIPYVNLGVLDVLIGFINGLTSLVNFLIMFLNYIIQLVQFLILIIKNLLTFKDSLIETAV